MLLSLLSSTCVACNHGGKKEVLYLHKSQGAARGVELPVPEPSAKEKRRSGMSDWSSTDSHFRFAQPPMSSACSREPRALPLCKRNTYTFFLIRVQLFLHAYITISIANFIRIKALPLTPPAVGR